MFMLLLLLCFTPPGKTEMIIGLLATRTYLRPYVLRLKCARTLMNVLDFLNNLVYIIIIFFIWLDKNFTK